MTPRERFRKLMKGESIDRLPVLALEPYESSALERWRREGLPADASPEDFLGMSRLTHVPVSFAPMPCFEARVLHEDETYVVDTTYLGATVRRRKDQPDMFYGHVDHPIKTRADWEQYKERLLAESPGRLPDNWHQEVVPRLRSSEHPVGVCLFPFFFRFCFYTLGMERFLSAFHEEPDLVRDIFSLLGQFFLEILRPVVSSVELDYVLFAEDLAGKNGPLISPKTYGDFWYPHQDPIVRLFQDHDVPLVCQWSAGQFQELIPGMLAHGFNCAWPLEVVAGMDAPALRKQFGPNLRLGGNIAKEAVIAGPEAIDREIDRLLPLIREGGFLPALDDMASPDMPFSHYRYLIQRLQNL